jgi:hypothetical protein
MRLSSLIFSFITRSTKILKLITTYVGEIYLATPVFNEINEIDENDCIEQGVILVEPELEQLLCDCDMGDRADLHTYRIRGITR